VADEALAKMVAQGRNRRCKPSWLRKGIKFNAWTPEAECLSWRWWRSQQAASCLFHGPETKKHEGVKDRELHGRCHAILGSVGGMRWEPESRPEGQQAGLRHPADFMAAVTARFVPITFDLAAHAGNAKSPNYFAPVTGPEGRCHATPRPSAWTPSTTRGASFPAIASAPTVQGTPLAQL